MQQTSWYAQFAKKQHIFVDVLVSLLLLLALSWLGLLLGQFSISVIPGSWSSTLAPPSSHF